MYPKFRLAKRVQRTGKRGENVDLLARIEQINSPQLEHASRSAGGIPPFNTEPFDIAGKPSWFCVPVGKMTRGFPPVR